jgi:zinc and cadmium transporter
LILVGNGVHSFCDGIVIAAAFLADPALGIAATLAIVAHAVPQQVGDFAVLLHSGFTRRKALMFNVGVGLATLAGALAAWFALADMQRVLPVVLAFAAASLLYVAVADLIPSLHRRPELRQTLGQVLAIALGIAVIGITHAALEH